MFSLKKYFFRQPTLFILFNSVPTSRVSINHCDKCGTFCWNQTGIKQEVGQASDSSVESVMCK